MSELETIPREMRSTAEPTSATGTAMTVAVDVLEPSAYNPRKHFDHDSLKDLAESIKSLGMQQPIVVRSLLSPTRPGRYEIVCGERRWRAARLAGVKMVPVILRALSDEEAAEIALVENLVRRDINAIEEAEGYQRLRDLGMTVTEIGRKVGRSQEAVSNSMRLLKLPEDVRQLIIQGTLAPAHGKALVRFHEFPAILSRMAQLVVEHKTTVKDCESEVPNGYRLDLITNLATYTFDRTICAKCPYGAAFQSGWKTWCFKPEHANQLQREHVAAEREIARAQIEAMMARRQAAAAPALPDRTIASEPEGPQPPSNAGATDSPLPELGEGTGVRSVPFREDMDPSTFTDVETYRKTEGCSEECPCRSVCVDKYGRISQICTDPARYKRLSAETRKADAKALKAKTAAILEDAEAAIQNDDGARLMGAIAISVLRNIPLGNTRQQFAKIPDLPKDVRSMLSRPPALEDAGTFARFGLLPTLRLLASILVKHQAVNSTIYGGEPKSELASWLIKPGAARAAAQTGTESSPCDRCSTPIPTSALDRYAEPDARGVIVNKSGVVTSPGAVYCAECAKTVQICRVCGYSDGVLTSSDEPLEWVEPDLCAACEGEEEAEACSNAAAADKDEEDTIEYCARCCQPIPDSDWENETPTHLGHYDVYPNGIKCNEIDMYCKECSRTVTICRMCRRSNDLGGRQYKIWTDPDLCPACAEKLADSL